MNEQQFGKLSANKIFIKCAIPGLLSLLSSSIYVVVDGIFIGKFLGSNALAALNLIFPIITILYAIGDMFAVGSSVKISLALGAGEKDFANRLFSNGVLTMFCINIVITVFGLIFAKPIIFGLIKDTLLAKDTYLYISSFLMFFPLSALLFATDDYLRACGKAKFSMTLNIVVSLLNIILDAIFIGVLKMDIRAAALTTGISTSIGTIISLLPFLFKKLTLRFTVPIVPI
ncbi:MAG: MATE family efflux transporter, partial [Oscillospiraceae bacterium]